jgi:Tol biopolymer transport system component
MSKYIALALTCAAAAFAAWQTPVNMGATLNTVYNEWYPLVSGNGSYMIFVSDRPGGRGGMDLWRANYANGSWQTPVNLGSFVNSGSNDSVPFLAENDTRLYFVSDAPGGYGSFDVWWCAMRAGTPTSDKVNLGPPVNTAYLDC